MPDIQGTFYYVNDKLLNGVRKKKLESEAPTSLTDVQLNAYNDLTTRILCNSISAYTFGIQSIRNKPLEHSTPPNRYKKAFFPLQLCISLTIENQQIYAKTTNLRLTFGNEILLEFAHKRLLFRGCLESTMTSLGAGIDPFQIYFLMGESLSLNNKRFSKSD